MSTVEPCPDNFVIRETPPGVVPCCTSFSEISALDPQSIPAFSRYLQIPILTNFAGARQTSVLRKRARFARERCRSERAPCDNPPPFFVHFPPCLCCAEAVNISVAPLGFARAVTKARSFTSRAFSLKTRILFHRIVT